MKQYVANNITTREGYELAKSQLDALIKEASKKGMLEPEADNEYIRQISQLAKDIAKYEDDYMNILPLREKNPLIQSIEDFFYSHNMKRKEVAELLEVNESVFSQIMAGKRKISMSLAKRLYERLNIDPKIIIEYS